MGRLARRRWAIAVLWLSGLMGFGARVAAGQAITVSGRAVDAVSGRAISGTQLTIGSRTTVTDAEGRFQFELSPPGAGRSKSGRVTTSHARSRLTSTRRASRRSRSS